MYTLPVMYLNEGINETQQDDIVIAPPKLNGESIIPRAMSGAIFEFNYRGKKEDIYTSRLIVNADNSMTLSGSVIRDLCTYTELRTFTTCNNSRSLPRGTEIRLTDNHRIFNLKADIDRANTFTGSGSLESSQTTQPFIFPNRVTTAQRDAFTYGTSSTQHPVIFNYTLGAFQGWNGTAWGTFAAAADTFVNAEENVAGKIELGTIQDHYSGSTLGVSGASTVVQTKNLTMSGGLVFAGKAVILDSNGQIRSTALLPYSANSASGVIIHSASGALRTLTGASGAVATFDARGNVIARQVEAPRTICSTTADSSTPSGDPAFAAYNQTCVISANSLSAGETIEIVWIVETENNTIYLKPRIDGKTILTDTTSCATGPRSRCRIEILAKVRNIGGSSVLIVDGIGYSYTAASPVRSTSTGSITVDSTSTITIDLLQADAGGGGSVNNVESMTVIVNPAP